MTKVCRCSHSNLAHHHFRPGTDCSTCPCPRWRRRWFR